MASRRRSILLGTATVAVLTLVVGWLIVRGRRPPPPKRIFATFEVGPGSPADAERTVAVVAERASFAIAGVEHVESRSTADTVVLSLTLSASTDPTTAQLAWSKALGDARSSLPVTASAPTFGSTGSRTLHFFVRSDKRQDPLVAEKIRPALQVVPGVRAVDACDLLEPEVRVTLDPARLIALGTDAIAITDAIDAAHPATIADLGKLPIAEKAAVPIRLEDVADVAQTHAPLSCRAYAPAGETTLLTVDLTDDAATTALDAAIAKLALPPKTSVEAIDPPGTNTIFAEVDLGGAQPEEIQATALLLAKLVGAATEIADVAIMSDPRTLDVDLVLHVALKPGVNKAAGREALARTLTSMPGTVAVTSDTAPAPALWIVGPELGRLGPLSDDVAKALRGLSGVRGVLQVDRTQATAVAFDVDRAAAARVGVDPSKAASLLRLATVGVPVSSGGGVPTRVVLGERHDVADTRALVIGTTNGLIPLVEIATMKTALEPRAILRLDSQRGIRIDVDAQPSVRQADLLAAAKTISLPAGYFVAAP